MRVVTAVCVSVSVFARVCDVLDHIYLYLCMNVDARILKSVLVNWCHLNNPSKVFQDSSDD